MLFGAYTYAIYGGPLGRNAVIRFSDNYEEDGPLSNNPYDVRDGHWNDVTGRYGNSPDAIKNIDEGRKCAKSAGY